MWNICLSESEFSHSICFQGHQFPCKFHFPPFLSFQKLVLWKFQASYNVFWSYLPPNSSQIDLTFPTHSIHFCFLLRNSSGPIHAAQIFLGMWYSKLRGMISFLWLNKLRCASHFYHPFICWWTFNLIPFPQFCELQT